MVAKTMNAITSICSRGILIRLSSLLIACVCFSGIQAYSAALTLQWDPNTEPDVVGYKLHYGPESRTISANGQYADEIDVGNLVISSLDTLSNSSTNFFAVTAYNSAGLESEFSNEVVGILLGDGQLLAISYVNEAAPDEVTLSWPSSATGYVLEFATDLSSPSWQEITAGIADAGGRKSITVNTASGNGFYRLRPPP